MENKFSYTLVGAFIVGFSLLFMALSVWLTVGTEKVSYVQYRVVTQESVAGLSVNSNIDYQGVQVGKVANISLNQDDPRFVTILLNINSGTPIKEDTKAVLIAKGITGLVGVSLTDGTPDSKLLLPTDHEPVPRIQNGPSLSKRLDEAINNITTSVAGLSDQFDGLLNDENIASINVTIKNIEAITTALNQSAPKVEKLIDDTSVLVATGNDIAVDAKPRINKLLEELKTTPEEINALLREWRTVANNTDGTISQLGPELSQMLFTISTLLEELRHQPSSLIMGKPQNKKGPGE
ncbi:MAG: MCE family protein [Xanthomonadaceae bacterium]|nr:MCE family protein [Xanthomonadaceae bacterium]